MEEFYVAFIDKIFTFCLYRTGKWQVAQDLTSATFLKFFKTNWRLYENPTAYLYTVCRNTIIDYYRQRKETVSLETLIESGHEVGATFDNDQRLLMMEIFKEIEKLPTDQKDVVLMRYVQDLDNKTIAQVLSKTEAAVKSLAHRGLTTLRGKLK